GGSAASRTGPAGHTTVAQGAGGNVYAGHDGNVYRSSGGSWQQWDNGSWSSANKPTSAERTSTGVGVQSGVGTTPPGDRSSTYSQLDRDQSARLNGADRMNNATEFRTSPSPRGAGSYRGMSGGGGGRRR